ncbi:MAG: HAD family hydrolase [Holophagaceae bacterium]|nr:HAD family hydrolase [Holophagaceae bacterium]
MAFTGGMGQLLVLDVDGVMIDSGGSFETCVAKTLKEMVPDLVWSDEMFWKFKRIPGFNNDFRLAATAVALFEAGEIGRLEDNIGFFPDLKKRIDELEPICGERMQYYYQDVKHLERPLISLPELETIQGWDVAILTGRLPVELAMAFDVLGFKLPAICDSCPEFRKPEPGGMLHLVNTFEAKKIIFVGDTRDDATCLRRARQARPDLNFTFVAVNKLRNEISQLGDLTFETLREFISSGILTATARAQN